MLFNIRILAVLFFLLVDNGNGLLTYLLLAGFGADCFFSFASAYGCRLVEEQNTSRTKTFGLLIREGVGRQEQAFYENVDYQSRSSER